MTPYLVLFGSFLLLTLGLEALTRGRDLTPTERLIPMVPLAVFGLAFAGRIGTDMYNYGALYSMAAEFPVEPGFSSLMVAAQWAGMDYLAFTKALALLQLVLLAGLVLRLREPLVFLLFYFSAFYLNFHFNALRNSLALLILANLVLAWPGQRLLALVGSTAIHYSSALTMAFQRLAQGRRVGLAIVLMAVMAGALALVWTRPELFGEQLGEMAGYKGYLDQAYETKALYPALLIKLMVVWLMTLNGGRRFYFAALAILVTLVHVVSPVLSRLSDLVLYLAVLDFCAHHRLARHRLAVLGLTSILVYGSLQIPAQDCQNEGEGNWCISSSFQAGHRAALDLSTRP